MVLEVSHDNFPLYRIIFDNVGQSRLIGGFIELLNGRDLFFFPTFCKHTEVCVQIELFYLHGSFES